MQHRSLLLRIQLKCLPHTTYSTCSVHKQRTTASRVRACKFHTEQHLHVASAEEAANKLKRRCMCWTVQRPRPAAAHGCTCWVMPQYIAARRARLPRPAACEARQARSIGALQALPRASCVAPGQAGARQSRPVMPHRTGCPRLLQGRGARHTAAHGPHVLGQQAGTPAQAPRSRSRCRPALGAAHAAAAGHLAHVGRVVPAHGPHERLVGGKQRRVDQRRAAERGRQAAEERAGALVAHGPPRAVHPPCIKHDCWVLEPAHSAILLMARRPRRRSVRVCAVSNPAWRERALPRVRATHGYFFARCPSTAGPAASTMAWHQPAAAHCSSRVGLGKCQASWVTRQCLRGARASGAPLYTAPYRAACMRLFMVSKGYTEAQLSTPAAPPAPPVSAPLGAPAALQHGCDSTGTARRSTQGAHTCMLDHRLAQPADAGVKKHERLHHCAIAPHANG